MKRILFLSIMLAALASCKSDPKVMARFVPERMDDFVWENDNVIYRAYGTALEAETLSPGFDVWVKTPGKLVADEWYRGAMENPNYYHFNRGNGKDCYKVAKSLGGGASAPLLDSLLVFPTHNYDSFEMVKETPDEVSFILNYPEWKVGEKTVKLAKQITLVSGTNFCQVKDVYTGDFDTLRIAAGIIRHNIISEKSGADYFAFWEEASDQSLEPEDGSLGLALYMPSADDVMLFGPANHSVAIKRVTPGEPLTYYFGSCWSKGNVPDFAGWVEMTTKFTGRVPY